MIKGFLRCVEVGMLVRSKSHRRRNLQVFITHERHVFLTGRNSRAERLETARRSRATKPPALKPQTTSASEAPLNSPKLP